MNSLATIARRSALVGAVVWLLLLPTTTTDSRETELIHKVVFFAILAVVPLVLSLVPVDTQQGGPFLYRLAVYVLVSDFFSRSQRRRVVPQWCWPLFTPIASPPTH